MQGIRSILCAPLMIGDAVVGVLYVDYLFNAAHDLRGRRAAGRADRALRGDQARDDAPARGSDPEADHGRGAEDRVDDPAPPPAGRAAGHRRLHVRRREPPCRTVSGDYYDFVRPSRRPVYFVIADVSGKGDHRRADDGRPAGGVPHLLARAIRRRPTLVRSSTYALKDNAAAVEVRDALPRPPRHRPRASIEYANAGHTPPLWVAQRRRRGARRDRPASSASSRAPSSASTDCSSPPATRSSSSPTASPRPRTKTAKTSAGSIIVAQPPRETARRRTRTTSPPRSNPRSSRTWATPPLADDVTLLVVSRNQTFKPQRHRDHGELFSVNSVSLWFNCIRFADFSVYSLRCPLPPHFCS